MTLATRVCVADVALELRADDATTLRRLEDRYAGRPGPLRETLPDDRTVRIAVEDGVATATHRQLTGTVELASSIVTTPPSMVFADALIRAAVAWRMASRGSLLLHASAVEVSDGAIVVFGASRAGKSTTARELGNALADELVELHHEGENRWTAVGTPWWLGGRRRARVHRIVWLVRGEPPSIRPSRGGELLRALAVESGRYVPESGFQSRAFELCARLAELGAVRVAAPEGRPVAAVREALT